MAYEIFTIDGIPSLLKDKESAGDILRWRHGDKEGSMINYAGRFNQAFELDNQNSDLAAVMGALNNLIVMQ